MKSSRTFALDASPGQRAVIAVHPAYTGWYVGGAVSMTVGAMVGLIGVPAVWVRSIGCGWSIGADSFGGTAPTGTQASCNREAGIELGAVAAVSVSAIVLGVIAVVTNESTTVTQGEHRDAPPAVAPAAAPAWRAAEFRDIPPLPPSFVAPIVPVRF